MMVGGVHSQNFPFSLVSRGIQCQRENVSPLLDDNTLLNILPLDIFKTARN